MSDTTELVDLAASSLIWEIELKYASAPDTITGKGYSSSKRVVCCDADAITALAKKYQASPSCQGCHLLIYDAYRPQQASGAMLWQACRTRICCWM